MRCASRLPHWANPGRPTTRDLSVHAAVHDIARELGAAPADVTEPGSLRDALDAARAELGPIDVLEYPPVPTPGGPLSSSPHPAWAGRS